MFEAKLGLFPTTKKVTLSDNVLIVGNNAIYLDEIETVYVAQATMMYVGYMYFSESGELPRYSTDIDKSGIRFTTKQMESVNELRSILEENLTFVETDISTKIILANDRKNLKNEVKEVSAEFKENKAQRQQAKFEKNRTKCPKCKSSDIQFLGNKRKGFSVGKAVGGAVLTGGIGTLAGFAGKKGKKDEWHCNNCGNVFKLKRK